MRNGGKTWPFTCNRCRLGHSLWPLSLAERCAPRGVARDREMRKALEAMLAIAIFVGASAAARADDIPVFATGVGDDHRVLAPGVPDSHYSIVQVPAGSGFTVP